MSERVSVLAVLENGPHEYARAALPLMRTLDGKRFSVETGPLTPSGHDVVLAASDQPLAPRQASALGTFVRRGGALVVLHSTLDAWLSSEAEEHTSELQSPM